MFHTFSSSILATAIEEESPEFELHEFKLAKIDLDSNNQDYIYIANQNDPSEDDVEEHLNLFHIEDGNEVIVIDEGDNDSLIEFNIKNNKLSDSQINFLNSIDFQNIDEIYNDYLIINRPESLINTLSLSDDSIGFIINNLDLDSLSIRGYIDNQFLNIVADENNYNIDKEIGDENFNGSEQNIDTENDETTSNDNSGETIDNEEGSDNSIDNDEKYIEEEDSKQSSEILDINNSEETSEISTEKKSIMTNSIALTSAISYQGIALQKNTPVYSSTSLNGNVLKSYPEGSILKYSSYSGNWYQTGVYINGKKHTGYIHKSHVENIYSESNSTDGVGIKSPTHVYSSPATNSSSLKTYQNGAYLKFSTFSDNWYQTGVYINGKKHIGYIHKSHVIARETNAKSLEGIGTKQQTPVYSGASTNTDVLKTYSTGSLLKYSSFSNNWYITGVYVNGKKHTGFINKFDVETATENPKSLEGIALQSSTSVYSSANLGSNKLKSYTKGSILKYSTFTNNWYQTGVYINGKKQSGFIHKSHVENAQRGPKTLSGFALQDTTHVYTRASTASQPLKSYNKGHVLKFREYSSGWYVTSVIINGKKVTGYINKTHITDKDPGPKTEYTNYNITLNKAIDIQNSQPIVITDKYRNSPAYVSASNVNLANGNGTIIASVVNIRTSPDTTKNNVAFQLRNGDNIDIVGEVKGTSVSGNTTWYEFKQNGKSYYVHSSLASTSSNVGTVNVTTANIHAEKSSSSHIYGTLQKGNKVTIINKDNAWHQVSMGTWRRPTKTDLREYLDPNKNDKMQHLRLDTSVNVSPSQLNNVLSGKGILSGKGQSFINGANKYGVNEAYLIAHAQLETGNGTSSLAKGVKYNGKTVYNMYGIGAVDSDPLNGGAKTAYENGWFTPEAAIEGGAKWISLQYIQNQHKQNTLYKMKWNPNMNNGYAWKQYATDIGWAVKQIKQINDIYKLLDNPTYHYDIVRYN